jgi:hypothetical protein
MCSECDVASPEPLYENNSSTSSSQHTSPSPLLTLYPSPLTINPHHSRSPSPTPFNMNSHHSLSPSPTPFPMNPYQSLTPSPSPSPLTPNYSLSPSPLPHQSLSPSPSGLHPHFPLSSPSPSTLSPYYHASSAAGPAPLQGRSHGMSFFPPTNSGCRPLGNLQHLGRTDILLKLPFHEI